MKTAFSETGWADYLYLLEKDRKSLKRTNELIKDISRNSFEGIGKPEPLKGNLTGYWSRRISDKDRLIYTVSGDTIYIIQCGRHYSDK